jgi:hypothetical protein
MTNIYNLKNPGLIALLATLSPISLSHAAWDVLPRVETLVLANDNVRMEEDSAGTATNSTRARIDGRVRFSTFNERGNLYVEPRVRADIYTEKENDDLESTNTYVRSAGSYSWELMTLGFSANYDLQDIRSAELVSAQQDDPDIDDPIVVDTGGITSFDETRERISVSPTVVFKASERSDIVLRASYVDVTYSTDSFFDDERSPFQNVELVGGISRRVDERNQVSANFISSHYEAELNANQTDSTGVEGNFTRVFDAGWTMNLDYGVMRSDFTFMNDKGELEDNADTNVVFNLGFRQRTERNTLNFNLSRQVVPNGSGFVTTRDELRVSLNRELSARLSAAIGVRIYETTRVGDDLERQDREYNRLELGLEWAMTERAFLTVGYDFVVQSFQTSDRGDATSNQIFVGFNYRGLGR